MYVPNGSNAIEKLNKSENAISRAKELTRQLLTFSKGGAPVKKRSQVADLLRDTVSFHLSGSPIKCGFKLSEDLWLSECDSDQLGLVIGNLVVNALEAMPGAGSMEVRAENMIVEADEAPPLRPGKYIKISIQDNGQGISKENLNKIFDPYFSTKDRVSERGLGLGLSIAHSIIKRHEGHIAVESEMGVGTTFHVYLPAIDEKAMSAERESELTGPGSGRLLIMDDEEALLEVAGEVLAHLGYETAFARNGLEAVEKYKKSMENGRPFDAVILDLTIPGGMGGKEAIIKLREIDPEVKALVSSGYSNERIMSNPEHYGFSDVIAKPYKIEQMAQALQRILKSRPT
jgi:CheY-like chemotaxis protein